MQFPQRSTFAISMTRSSSLMFTGNRILTCGPDTVVQQIKEYREQCGVGVVDLFFQQPSVGHKEVMEEIELFGKEVLPQIKEL